MPQSSKLQEHIAFGSFIHLSHFSCEQAILITAASSVAQLDACPTADQEVAVILSHQRIQEGQLSVSGKRMCTMLVNRLED